MMLENFYFVFLFFSDEMSQKCWIKHRGLVYQTDYEEVKSRYKKNNIALLQNNVAYLFLPTIAPESSKDNPFVVVDLEIWIKCNDEEVILETFDVTDTIATFCHVAKEHLDVTLQGISYSAETKMIDFVNKTTQLTPLCILDIGKCVSFPSSVGEIGLSKDMTFKQLLHTTKCQGFIDNVEVTSSQMSLKLSDFARSRHTIQLFPGFNFNLTSASSLAKTDHGRRRIMDNFEEHHIYENWFAMKIYESEVTEPAKDLAQMVQSILHFENYSKEAKVSDMEVMYTGVLSSAFDVFLHHAHYRCLHQVPIWTTERPDFYMAKEGEEGYLLSWPSLLGHYKISSDDFELAVAESYKYYISMIDKSRDKFPALLMPCCSQKFQLCLCIPYRAKQIVMIKIMEAEVNDSANLAKLFSAMHYGVTHLHPMMFNNLLFVPAPLEGLRLNNYEYMSKHSFRVLRCNGKIYKFYDTDEMIFPNKKIIEGLCSDYLLDMEELCLTTCKRFQMFSYRYMEQSTTKPNSLQYFKNVMQALDTLHEQSVVHSDVRFANLLFLDEDAKIIDFDHANTVGTSYPSNFNFQLPERHPDLLSGKVKKRWTSHDRYSLAFIILRTLKGTLTEKEVSFFEKIQIGYSTAKLCDIFSDT